MESIGDMYSQQRPPVKEIGAREISQPKRFRDRATIKALERERRANAALIDRVARLERKCLELQHENAELRHSHKKAFAILREAH